MIFISVLDENNINKEKIVKSNYSLNCSNCVKNLFLTFFFINLIDFKKTQKFIN